ncbi:MAG: peptidoglycan DD-metalloendopeptidase family protein [Bacillota bacterium]
MNLDLRGKILAASLVGALVIAPAGVWGFRNWRAQAAAPSTNTLVASPSVGQPTTLAVSPEAAPAQEPASAKSEAAKASEKKPLWQDYVVAEGDTLSGVAEKFGLSVGAIAASNGLDEEAVLAVGQQLAIPTADGVIHQTTEGDSLWYLASLYQVTLESILQANPEVNPDTLAPDTKLFIPGATPVRTRDAAANRGGGEEESTPVQSSPSASTGNSGSTFGLWPTSGPITSYYGWREDPVYGGGQFHKGLDIGAPTGEPVVAVGSGRVVMAGSYGGYGLTVMIDHQNGIVTRYSHLSRIDVSEGQRVSAGEQVGAVGSTGKSTGPHLDFGVNAGGQTADPLDYLP